MIWPILEARAEIQKYFRPFFDSNENFVIGFQDLLTFSKYSFYKRTNICLYGRKLATIL